ncbi:aminotransferase class I/II-fold pyridoxal phosphate-dependent enzyme [Patescibacteria group bacterium]|nr:aminotransferase class I/II-fold pyridoxal phosphate-dependent enzyme [Patescibacteria group bacterium]MBU1895356.1 aminotransferase class I/II-fold pyridoxal phosphate-dependent enzyme [Patescibacteria group bacterium]
MKFFKKPIFTGFAPNMTRQDIKIACGFLFLPWNWKRLKEGPNAKKVENWFKKYFKCKRVYTFDSGRSSLFYALKALGVSEGDEVLVQGYTCVVVSNAILWVGATPVYVDIEDDLNMSPEDLETKITDKSKVLIIQHTFGLPAKLGELMKIARKHNLKVIEDCAHSLGAKYKEKLTGTFGDLAFFSFGSDKVVSSVRGGCVITNNDELGDKLEKYRSRLPHADMLKIFQHLWYYPIFAIAKPLYNFGIGKLIFFIVRKLHITASIIYPQEKKCKQIIFYPSLYSNALATILLNQLKKLDKSNMRREIIADGYIKSAQWKRDYQRSQDGRVWLYFTVFINKPLRVAEEMKKHGFIVGTDWTGSVIVPRGVSLDLAGYRMGSCPNAERLSNRILNLPTNRLINKRNGKIDYV